MSAATKAKTQRLLDTGAVTPIKDQPRAFTVQGDTGTYRVVIGFHIAWCDCRAGITRGACSHIDAARRWMDQGAPA